MSQGVQRSDYVSSSAAPVSPILKRQVSYPLEGESKPKKARDDGKSDRSQTPPLGLQSTPPRQMRLHLSLSFSESFEPFCASDADLKAHQKSQELLSQPSEAIALKEEMSPPLQVRFYSASQQGKRPTNEDAEFHCMIDGIGALAGIYDGHGGSRVAKMTAQIFEKEFPVMIRSDPSRAEEIMKELSTSSHERVRHIEGGTTALTTFFDLVNNRLIVATSGDSRAMLFRKAGENIEYEWLSKELNWADAGEKERARIAFQDEEIFKKWEAFPAKQRYFPHFPLFENRRTQRLVPQGVNVSRSIGDARWTYEGRAAIIQEPDIKTIDLAENIFILEGCDGLWDFARIDRLIHEVILPHWEHPHMPEKVAEYALETSTDNVTIICAWVTRVDAPEFHNTQPTPATQSLGDSD